MKKIFHNLYSAVLWYRNARLLRRYMETRNLSCQIFTHPAGEYATLVKDELTEEELEGATDLWRVTRLMTYPTKKLEKELIVLDKALRFQR